MNNSVTQAVVLAGGMGTRLKPFTDNHPKPMYRFNNIPFIEYLILQICEFGIKDIILLLGYKADEIKNYLGDGSKYGVSILYNVTPVEYDTGDRLLAVRNLLRERFLLMYCDNYCPMKLEKNIQDAILNDADVQLAVYSNKDGYTRDNLKIAEDGQVLIYDKKREASGLKGVDIGYAIIKKQVLGQLDELEQPVNFEKVVYPICVNNGTLYATITDHRYYSVGSWERIELTKEFFKKRKVIFLDRDGTLNVRPPKACYIERKEDFIWLDGAKEAIRILKEAGYDIVLVSNQPGIARGNLTEEILGQIHDKMQKDLLEAIGYKIDYIYYCPHNWDDGCDCRKPKPGMLYKAQMDLSIDLTKSILVGDDERDIEAGMAAGCRCYQVTDTRSLLDIVKEIVG